ncbi:MAG: M48 family peptidase, partial [Bryobacteraceae bacterium]
HVRISDILREAPREVMEAVAATLLSRLYRRRAPRELLDAYRRFSMARGTRRRVLRTRGQRGRRVKSGARGEAHNLAPMFSRLNKTYFAGRLHHPRLGWSARAWRAQLGCFDPGLDQIVMNVRLDREAVPAYVVEYVLYHEMLHVKHPIRAASCGLQAHSAAFRREERRFAHYERAYKFLERMS